MLEPVGEVGDLWSCGTSGRAGGEGGAVSPPRMTVVRARGGEDSQRSSLFLVNPVIRLVAELAELDQLGHVAAILTLSNSVADDAVSFYHERYPTAAVWSVSSDVDDFPVDDVIDDAHLFRFAPGAEGRREAVLRLRRAGGVLVSGDALQNVDGAEIGPVWFSSYKPDATDFQRLLRLSFRHVVPYLGSPLLADAYVAFEATIRALIGDSLTTTVTTPSLRSSGEQPAVEIVPLSHELRAQWESAWAQYIEFYDQPALSRSVVDTTFSRMVSGERGEFSCLLACQKTSDQPSGWEVLGLAHFVFHRKAWQIENTCYLQDLYVHESARGRGVGRKLIAAVVDAARRDGASSVYWKTERTNTTARLLYDQVANTTPFVEYKMGTGI
jgi:GNAT superfamily N-acetyltransferase